jgi:putative endonuclease
MNQEAQRKKSKDSTGANQIKRTSSPRKRGPRASDGQIVDKQPCVYIMASQRNGTLYVGVTSNIVRRAWEHRTDFVDGFTRDYGVHRLVFFEFHHPMEEAILREKRIKKWRRRWKLELIERSNPQWCDLYDDLRS